LKRKSGIFCLQTRRQKELQFDYERMVYRQQDALLVVNVVNLLQSHDFRLQTDFKCIKSVVLFVSNEPHPTESPSSFLFQKEEEEGRKEKKRKEKKLE